MDEIDYILQVLNEFREKHAKVGLDGIAYEVYLGQVEHNAYWEDEAGHYDGTKAAVENLKGAGVITKYTIEERYESELLKIPMTKSIKSTKTKYRPWKLKWQNIVKQTTITKQPLLQSFL